MLTKKIIYLKLCFSVLFCLKGQTIPYIKINPLVKSSCVNQPLSYSSIVVYADPNAPENIFFPTTYTWSIIPNNSSTKLSNINAPNITITSSVITTFTLVLEVERGDFSALTSSVITISDYPKASFNASFNQIGFPNQLNLTNYSTNNISNLWIYSDTPKVDSSFNAVKNYTTSGNYTVTLISIAKQGCSDTASYSFFIPDSSNVILPNVFSPNNDNINDIYKPITKGISSLSAKIFNRNAVLINAWEGDGGFWDGYTNSGEPCASGEYFIILNATGFDGKTYKLQSHITLLR